MCDYIYWALRLPYEVAGPFTIWLYTNGIEFHSGGSFKCAHVIIKGTRSQISKAYTYLEALKGGELEW